MPCRYQEVEVLLKKLKQQMLLVQLWSTHSPSEEALNSTAPFACDKMTFEDWLQFVFINKIKAIVVSEGIFPNRLSLMPMAEQCFIDKRYLGVLSVIDEIDKTFEKLSRG